MKDQNAVLDPQQDENASSEVDDRFANDTSVDTAPDLTPEPDEVETKSEDDVEEPESEADSSPAVEKDDDEKTDPQPGDVEYTAAVKERIDKLTERFRESDRAVAERDLRIAELEKQLEAVPKETEPFKTLSDFEFDEAKYQEYMGAEIDRRATAAAEKVAQGFQSKVSNETRQDAFRAREKEFAKTVPDYHDVVYGEVDGIRGWKASEAMAREIELSDMGEKLAYHLASNPDIADEISKLPERETVRRMALLESTLNAEKAKAKPKKVSDTPPPPPKIKSGDAGLEKDPADMSDSQFKKWRLKQIANR